MKAGKFTWRHAALTAMFAAAMGLGVTQAVATGFDAPGTQYLGCTSTQCQRYCANGGQYIPARPGEPWECICCN